MQRAHSFVTIKRADVEARRITGIASTPATDRQGDILDPMGARFKLPFPLLLGHDHDAPIGEVIEARATPKGIYVVCQCAPEGTTAKADEGWRAIRAGLIRGLSVGFIGKDWEPLPTGGRRFKEWEVIELSAVAVPANSEAAILEVKRLDDAMAAPASEAPADIVPSYPAHLTQGERQAVLEKAARDLYESGIQQTAKALKTTAAALRVKWGREHEIAETAKAEDMILRRWHGERLTALEAAVEHMKGKANGN
ncbi:HK97 family phage prohead protease [Paracoccus yeei]|jgi:HK97 family phage prohead protease|uniref:HK97 family phage prohead protease n=1 Tax=Paracoccus yeei TaxID=147645 RepID=UPI003BF80B25